MTALGDKLCRRIADDGPIPIDEWMAACLADPEHGYYLTRDPLGRYGDFVTSPEISQMFGELLALWAAVVWQRIGRPGAVSIVELGPGRGTLMADACRAFKGVPGFRDAITIHLVETSPVLIEKQRALLANTGFSVHWHAALDRVPDGPAIVLANEFLDALPVRQFQFTDGLWHHRTVDWDGTRFVYAPGAPADTELIPEPFRDASEGAVFEDSPAVDAVVRTLAGRLKAAPGVALLIDYGHDVRGLGETLQAVRGHAFANPIGDPGRHDLTAHIDFAVVARAAAETGAAAHGPITQGLLLDRLGIAERTATLLANATPEQADDIASARERLTADGAMGRLFKAVALTSPDLPAPPGFEGLR